MTTVEMTKRESWQLGYTYEETIAGGQTGDVVIIRPDNSKGSITCTIIAGSNEGKFQFTTSPDASVKAGTCVWIDWPKGAVSGTNYDVIAGPVTAVRGVSVSGEINIEIVR